MFNKFFLSLAIVVLVSSAESYKNSTALQTSTVYDIFLQGFIQGIQINPASPSNCVKSYSDIGTSYKAMIATFDKIGVNTIFDFLNRFNDFVNQFVNSYGICSYSTIYNNYFSSKDDAILNFLVNFFANYFEIIAGLELIPQYKATGDYTNLGIDIGQIFRYCTGISL